MDVMPAVIGLLGVVVGSVISVGANWLLARRREEVEAERDRRNHAIEVRRASRLIDLELSIAATAARICVEKKRWWIADVQLKTESWQKHRDVIAPVLSDSDWLAVTVAFMALDHLSGLADDQGRTLEITDEVAAGFTRILQDILKGRQALGSMLG